MIHDPLMAQPVMPERNIVEAFLLGLALWTAVHTLFFQPEPLAVDLLLGSVWTAVWVVTLFGGSIISLAGLYWPGRPLTAASLHEIGYAMFVPASLARGVALVAVGRPDDAVVMFAFAVICLARVVQIEHRIGRYYPVGVYTWLRRMVRRG